MSNDETNRDEAAVHRLLAGAARLAGASRYCWLITVGVDASANARPMGPIARMLDPDDWTLSFVTDGRSRKTDEIRRAGNVSLLFESDPEEAFVRLNGRATLQTGRSEVDQRWKSAYDPFFPTEEDRRNAAFLDVRIDRMDLWIRGVTPEPFGMQTTTLARDGQGRWRLA